MPKLGTPFSRLVALSTQPPAMGRNVPWRRNKKKQK
jgi:hypothetical protein